MILKRSNNGVSLITLIITIVVIIILVAIIFNMTQGPADRALFTRFKQDSKRCWNTKTNKFKARARWNYYK